MGVLILLSKNMISKKISGGRLIANANIRLEAALAYNKNKIVFYLNEKCALMRTLFSLVRITGSCIIRKWPSIIQYLIEIH